VILSIACTYTIALVFKTRYDLSTIIRVANIMFDGLSNFGLKRTPLQAVGFYIAYLVVTIVVAGMFGGVVSLFSGQIDSLDFNAQAGKYFEAGICAVLGFIVLKKKNRRGDYVSYSLVLLSVILAAIAGGVSGLVLIAYLTTKQNRSTGLSRHTPDTVKPPPA
jgi:hypothetical protein